MILPEAAQKEVRDMKLLGKRVFGIKTVGNVPNLDNFSGCSNCDGAGKVGVQVIIGGPYNEPDNRKQVTHIDGQWYKQNTILYTCPECGGSGR